jgi:hypothetical protein
MVIPAVNGLRNTFRSIRESKRVPLRLKALGVTAIAGKNPVNEHRLAALNLAAMGGHLDVRHSTASIATHQEHPQFPVRFSVGEDGGLFAQIDTGINKSKIVIPARGGQITVTRKSQSAKYNPTFFDPPQYIAATKRSTRFPSKAEQIIDLIEHVKAALDAVPMSGSAKAPKTRKQSPS